MTQSLHLSSLSAARRALHAGDLESVLQSTRALLRRYGTPPFPLPFAGGLPEVDALLDALGGKLRDEAGDGAAPPQGDWILATCLYETGGHTPVMRDLATALDGTLEGIVLTLTGHDPAELTPRAIARAATRDGFVRRAEAPTMLGTCQRVLELFRDAPPRRLFLFHYPDDSAAVAAAAALALAGTELWLVHHADSYPSAGLHLPRLRIIDITPRACAFVRHVLGLRTSWLPVTCPDPGPRPRGFLNRGHLTTALSGSIYKTSQESAVSYPELVASVLSATGGTHVHIGPLREEQLASLRAAVEAAGIGPERFIHVPFAETLVEALRAEKVDLLLNTWPFGGARASVEAMAAAVPVVWHAGPSSGATPRPLMAYAGAEQWSGLHDLAALLTRVDRDWLESQSLAARRHYEVRHHPSQWRAFFQDGTSIAEPALPEGADAALFLPALWNTLLDLALDTRDQALADLKSRTRNQQERLEDLAALKQRLKAVERELKESRFPWPVRLWRRWRKQAHEKSDPS